jgi:hypothetical protein
MRRSLFFLLLLFFREVPPMTKVVTLQAQQRWDYWFESRKTEAALLNALNTLGQQGWDLVNVLYYKDLKGIMTWTAFVKRPSATQPSSANLQGAKAGSAEEKQAVPRGFDLSGAEFQMKAEPPEQKKEEAAEKPEEHG